MSRPNAQKRKRKASLVKNQEASESVPGSFINNKAKGWGQTASTNVPSGSTKVSPLDHSDQALELEDSGSEQEGLFQFTHAQLHTTCKELAVLFQQLLDLSTRKTILGNPVLFEPAFRILALLPSAITANLQDLEPSAPKNPLKASGYPTAEPPKIWKKIQSIVDFELVKSEVLEPAAKLSRKPSPLSNTTSPVVPWSDSPSPDYATVAKGYRYSRRESSCSTMDGDPGYYTATPSFPRPMGNVFSENAYQVLQKGCEAEIQTSKVETTGTKRPGRKSFSEALVGTTPTRKSFSETLLETTPDDPSTTSGWQSVPVGGYKVRTKTKRRSSFHQEAPKKNTNGYSSSGGVVLDQVGFSLALRSAESLRSIQEQIALRAFPDLVQQGFWKYIHSEDLLSYSNEDKISLAWSALKSDEELFRSSEGVGDWNYYFNWSPEETANALWMQEFTSGTQFRAFESFFNAMHTLGMEDQHWFAMAAFRRWRNGLAHPKHSEPGLQKKAMADFVAHARNRRPANLHQGVIDEISGMLSLGVVERVFDGA